MRCSADLFGRRARYRCPAGRLDRMMAIDLCDYAHLLPSSKRMFGINNGRTTKSGTTSRCRLAPAPSFGPRPVGLRSSCPIIL